MQEENATPLKKARARYELKHAPVNVRLPRALAAAIDDRRGEQSRAAWIIALIEREIARRK